MYRVVVQLLELCGTHLWAGWTITPGQRNEVGRALASARSTLNRLEEAVWTDTAVCERWQKNEDTFRTHSSFSKVSRSEPWMLRLSARALLSCAFGSKLTLACLLRHWGHFEGWYDLVALVGF